ncbi:MAG TPA: Fe-S cluster assembly protein SufD [Pyrinomonadaceae bacterium]|nr:Fe-S cluster assembly protein SufD [Pyrinomonadaceae bacterium]
MVAEATREKSIYAEMFAALKGKSAGHEASWTKRLREDAMERFEQLGFPTTFDEEWKYTNLAAITKQRFEPGSESKSVKLDGNALESFVYPEAKGSQLVFVDGVYSPALSSLEALPKGVIAENLADALNGERAEIVREKLARSADYNENGLTALNTAFVSEGAFVLIPKGVRVEAPIHLLFLTAPQRSPTVAFPRVLIVAEAQSEATVVESYASMGDGRYWTNAVVEVVLKDGARLEHYKIQRESLQAFHTATTQIELGADSSFDTTAITFGAELSRHNINVMMNARGAECHVDGLYMVSTGQHTDTHSLIEHAQPYCTSRQLYKGILDGKSRAVFNGKVFVREGALQTDAQQTNRNLLLSNEARVDTKPQLEIFADDVKCAHGATVGQLEEEELFYLVSRGLKPELAQNLLTYGFAEEVINKIKIESIKAQLDEAVLNRLHAKL